VTIAESALKSMGIFMYTYLLQHNSAADSKAARDAGNKQTGACMHANCYVGAATDGLE